MEIARSCRAFIALIALVTFGCASSNDRHVSSVPTQVPITTFTYDFSSAAARKGELVGMCDARSDVKVGDKRVGWGSVTAVVQEVLNQNTSCGSNVRVSVRLEDIYSPPLTIQVPTDLRVKQPTGFEIFQGQRLAATAGTQDWGQGVLIGIFSKTHSPSLDEMAQNLQRGAGAGLDNRIVDDIENIEIGGLPARRYSHSGNLKTGKKGHFTYQTTLVEGSAEIVRVTVYSSTQIWALNNSRFLAIPKSLTGLLPPSATASQSNGSQVQSVISPRDAPVSSPTGISAPPLSDQTKLTIDVAKTKCANLGFKPATEGFGKCVLQLSR